MIEILRQCLNAYFTNRVNVKILMSKLSMSKALTTLLSYRWHSLHDVRVVDEARMRQGRR